MRSCIHDNNALFMRSCIYDNEALLMRSCISDNEMLLGMPQSQPQGKGQFCDE